MLIALIGPSLAGKTTVARYLIERHAFTNVTVSYAQCGSSRTTTAPATPALDEHTRTLSLSSQSASLNFASHADLLTHVTSHWRDNFVTEDLGCSTDISLGFDKRPFFLLVAVDASFMTRAERCR